VLLPALLLLLLMLFAASASGIAVAPAAAAAAAVGVIVGRFWICWSAGLLPVQPFPTHQCQQWQQPKLPFQALSMTRYQGIMTGWGWLTAMRIWYAITCCYARV
jgi:hypothetical protein